MNKYAELIDPSLKKLRLAIALNMSAQFDVTASKTLAEVLQRMAMQLDHHAIDRRERSKSLAALQAEIDQIRSEIEAFKIINRGAMMRSPAKWFVSMVQTTSKAYSRCRRR